MYAKVFTQIYDGTLCTKGPWQALVTFQQLLILSDQDGNVDMTASAIARRTTIPLEIIELGIECLLKEDPESRTPVEDGKRIVPLSDSRSWGWHIVNYKHYRALKREEDRREYHRDYWHKRKLNNSTDTQHTQPNQPIAEAEAKAEAKKTTSSSKPAAFVAPDWVPEEPWKAFVQMRKAIRGVPFTEAAAKGVVRELEKLRDQGHDPGQMLDTSVLNGWRTVYPPKSNNHGSQSSGESAWQRSQRERAAELAPRTARQDPTILKPVATVIDMETKHVLVGPGH
jgi:hypothetical protein